MLQPRDVIRSRMKRRVEEAERLSELQPEKRMLSEAMADAINGLQLGNLSSVPSPPLEGAGEDMTDVGAATSPSPPRVHRCAVRLRHASCTALVLYVEPSAVIAEALRRPSSGDSPLVGRMEL